ncbi:hypothetical protein CRG98_014332 [Punica granatum]|uniref:Uncharacterized protein n=1 Tax=Punica granatum TaxID=22663 RepID=A0A2I0K9U2_PUNGR|nr:hypothetical protein CRG98_014332 [Punica granatum]
MPALCASGGIFITCPARLCGGSGDVVAYSSTTFPCLDVWLLSYLQADWFWGGEVPWSVIFGVGCWLLWSSKRLFDPQFTLPRSTTEVVSRTARSFDKANAALEPICTRRRNGSAGSGHSLAMSNLISMALLWVIRVMPVLVVYCEMKMVSGCLAMLVILSSPQLL